MGAHRRRPQGLRRRRAADLLGQPAFSSAPAKVAAAFPGRKAGLPAVPCVTLTLRIRSPAALTIAVTPWLSWTTPPDAASDLAVPISVVNSPPATPGAAAVTFAPLAGVPGPGSATVLLGACALAEAVPTQTALGTTPVPTPIGLGPLSPERAALSHCTSTCPPPLVAVNVADTPSSLPVATSITTPVLDWVKPLPSSARAFANRALSAAPHSVWCGTTLVMAAVETPVTAAALEAVGVGWAPPLPAAPLASPDWP